MNKEEIIAYLKENLKVEVKNTGGDYGSPNFVEVTLLLDGEIISQDSDSL